jgi:hypothetical protein
VLLDLGPCRGPLDGKDRSARTHQRETPGREPAERRDGASGDHVGRSQYVDALLGAAADDVDPIQAQLVDGLGQKYGSTRERFHKGDSKIRARHC